MPYNKEELEYLTGIDSHILSEYHNGVSKAFRVDNESSPDFSWDAAQNYDICSDLAIELLIASGIESDSEDLLGVQVSGDVQTLLMLAMFRSPELRMFIEKALEDN